MSKIMRMELVQNEHGGGVALSLDGVPMDRARNAVLDMSVGAPPTLTLSLVGVTWDAIDVIVHVGLDDETGGLLQWLGWTPPEELE